jgi:hypothetical protein
LGSRDNDCDPKLGPERGMTPDEKPYTDWAAGKSKNFTHPTPIIYKLIFIISVSYEAFLKSV